MSWLAAAAFGGSLLSAFGGRSQNKANQAAAREQMAFQKESAQNQYSWAMDDMRRSGLNPILAYQQGGSGRLAGASYSSVNVGEAAGAGGARAVGTGMALQRLNADIENIKSQTDKTRAETRNVNLKAFGYAADAMINRIKIGAITTGLNTTTSAADAARNWKPPTRAPNRKTSWSPYNRSLTDYSNPTRRNYTGGPMGRGWFSDRYRN